MTLLLLFQAFAKFLQQLFKTAERFDLGFFLIGEIFLQFGPQPIFRYQGINDVVNTLHLAEPGAKGPIEAVKVLLVFDKTCSGQKIEIINRRKRQPCLKRLQQHQVLFDRYGDTGLL